MYRGTTEQITFEIDETYDLSKVKEVWITFEVLLYKKTYKKSEDNITIDTDNNYIILTLSQEETLAFPKGDTKIQIRFLDEDDNAAVSEIVEYHIYDILQGGVIS